MNNLPREQLKYIITQYGRLLSEDPQRCEALLRDLCGQYRKEINVLISAVKEQVPTDLLNSQNSVPSDLLLARLAKRLEDRLGLSQDAAKWAVESWALALGLISEGELENEVGKQVAFEQNLKWQEAESKAQADQAHVNQQLEIARLEAEIAARAEQDLRQEAFEQNLKRQEILNTQVQREQAIASEQSNQLVSDSLIYIGNLFEQATKEDLYQVFSEYGTVTSLSMPILLEGKSDCFAVIEMSRSEEAIKAIDALDCAEWMGYGIEVRQATEDEIDIATIGGLEITIKANAEETARKNQNQVAMVCVRRIPQMEGSAGSYDVLINDEVVGNLWDGQEVMIPRPAGRIEIKVKVKGWFRNESKPQTVDLSLGQTIVFECGQGFMSIYLKIIEVKQIK